MMSDFKHLWKKVKKDSALPIFGYDCGRCKKFYEYFHNGADDKKAICPYCGSNDAKKKPSAPSGIVKGASAKNNYGLKR